MDFNATYTVESDAPPPLTLTEMRRWNETAVWAQRMGTQDIEGVYRRLKEVGYVEYLEWSEAQDAVKGSVKP